MLDEQMGASFTRCLIADVHASHATTVIVGLDADVTVGKVRGRAIIVPPDVEHPARCPGPTVALTFDPDRSPGIAGFARERGIASLDARLAGPIFEAAASLRTPEILRDAGMAVGAQLARGTPHRVDRRVSAVVESLREGELDPAALTATRLSPAHLRALFVRDVGVPIRTYALWRRLLHALARIGPCDYTTAAHAAGFSDLAHFSRTCRRMLGYAPSQLHGRLVGM